MRTLTDRKKSGFTLIEVIVFVSVFSVALVSLIASVIYSSLLLKDARHRIVATRSSEELSEWLKFQREYEGFDFVAGKITNDSTTYCFNNTDFNWTESTACENYSLLDFYKREVVLSFPNSPDLSKIKVVVATSWQALKTEKSVDITLNFNDY